jgi:hypothetical protein
VSKHDRERHVEKLHPGRETETGKGSQGPLVLSGMEVQDNGEYQLETLMPLWPLIPPS